ncbi:Extracellular signal-regulated kinase 1 [Phytophthora cinnamomi]|uniref:Extracellular signal-regulated kinase 1 n=1 Tax=Phytophthora cinnamomi TaxID=4785 RepID=UPI00355A69EB|nr:Extracellular signal-regulated kinase 1 [Phytophthora cinnamomi]
MGAAGVDVDVPLLTAVRLVTRFCVGDDDLPHVARLVDAFLDSFSSRWTLARSYKRTGSLRLMQYIAARQPAETMDPFYRRWMLNATSWFVAGRADLPALQWLMEVYLPGEQLGAAVYAAAANGHLEVLEWLDKFHHDRIYWNSIEMCGALDYGHEEVVQWLREHSPPRPECLKLVTRSAAKTGNLAAVRWLCTECGARAEDALVIAQNEGHWDTARWILVNCDLVERRIKCDGAAASGTLSFLKYAFSQGLGEPRPSTLVAAAGNGHLGVVKWLHDEGPPECGEVAAR